MICINECRNCKHKRPLIDNWLSCCDAFPKGKPIDFDYSKISVGKECNNGIEFEPKEQNNN